MRGMSTAALVFVALASGAASAQAGDEPGEDLLKAAKKGDVAQVATLLAAGIDINTDGSRRPHAARSTPCAEDRPAVVDALWLPAQNIDVRDKDGRTALFEAAKEERLGMVEALLAARANRDIQDKDGRRALLEAGRAAQWPAVLALVRGNAGVNQQDGKGNTALMEACKEDNLLVVEALLKPGADRPAATAAGPRLWRHEEEPRRDRPAAARRWRLAERAQQPRRDARYAASDPELVRLLLAAGAQAEVRDRSGETVLMRAARSDQSEKAEMLIHAGARVD